MDLTCSKFITVSQLDLQYCIGLIDKTANPSSFMDILHTQSQQLSDILDRIRWWRTNADMVHRLMIKMYKTELNFYISETRYPDLEKQVILFSEMSMDYIGISVYMNLIEIPLTVVTDIYNEEFVNTLIYDELMKRIKQLSV
jgi:hypothetical protein